MSTAAVKEIDALIARFQTREPLRIWSLIITVFGDSIVPRGGELWLGSLLALLDRMGIAAGAVRAANSRLVADGWLVRARQGRKSFYRLAPAVEGEFAAAARRIYAADGPDWSGGWTICVLTDPAGPARDQCRQRLLADGFGAVAANVLIRPETGFAAPLMPPPAGALLFTADTPDPYVTLRLDPAIWPRDKAAAGYRDVIEAFTPLADALAPDIDPLAALAARTLLIHDFRRAVLHDPMLPAAVQGEGWIGDAARALAADLYHRLLGPSETWWDDHGRGAGGPLSPAHADLARRFRDL